MTTTTTDDSPPSPPPNSPTNHRENSTGNLPDDVPESIVVNVKEIHADGHSLITLSTTDSVAHKLPEKLHGPVTTVSVNTTECKGQESTIQNSQIEDIVAPSPQFQPAATSPHPEALYNFPGSTVPGNESEIQSAGPETNNSLHHGLHGNNPLALLAENNGNHSEVHGGHVQRVDAVAGAPSSPPAAEEATTCNLPGSVEYFDNDTETKSRPGGAKSQNPYPDDPPPPYLSNASLPMAAAERVVYSPPSDAQFQIPPSQLGYGE